jgi:hypothetical protein
MAKGRRATPPVIALDAGNNSSRASTFAADRVPWKYKSYERLAAEEIGADRARNPHLLHEHYFAAFGHRDVVHLLLMDILVHFGDDFCLGGELMRVAASLLRLPR